MFFYGFLVLVTLGILVWLIRSPIVRQLRRGNGIDTARFGNRVYDHLADAGFYRGNVGDDQGSKPESRRYRKATYRVSQHVVKPGDGSGTRRLSAEERSILERRSAGRGFARATAARGQSLRSRARNARPRDLMTEYLSATDPEPSSRWRELASRTRGCWPRRRIAKYALIGMAVGVWVAEEWQFIAAAWRG
jgi:hypothetical protein